MKPERDEPQQQPPHKQWAPGDKVQVLLPDRGGLKGYRGRMCWFTGTVRDVDTGPCPGVRVDLDYPVSGVSDCYATHAELRRD
jgi:hypothetical protein